MIPATAKLSQRNGPDAEFVRQNWKPLKLRLAKKRNPYMFTGRLKLLRRKSMFFTCTQLTAAGCGAYESRPPVCSGYPFYGRTAEEAHSRGYVPNEYSADCVYIIKELL